MYYQQDQLVNSLFDTNYGKVFITQFDLMQILKDII
jgi:hypothetical protein